MNTDPLPLRTCSRCVNWERTYIAPDNTGKQKAPCIVLNNEHKYGSDSCIKWTKIIIDLNN